MIKNKIKVTGLHLKSLNSSIYEIGGLSLYLCSFAGKRRSFFDEEIILNPRKCLKRAT